MSKKAAQETSLLDMLKKKMRQAREEAENARDEAEEAQRKLEEERKKREEVNSLLLYRQYSSQNLAQANY